MVDTGYPLYRPEDHGRGAGTGGGVNARHVAAPLVLFVLGALAAAVVPGRAGTAGAIVLVGTGCVVAVSLLFWRVGRSEDEERRGP